MTKLFGDKITPQCRHCVHGVLRKGRGQILCSKKGLCAPESSCGKFLYDPLKRAPRIAPLLPAHNPAEFSLEDSDEEERTNSLL